MSESSNNLWYQLGYTLETARQRVPAPRKVSAEADEGDGLSSPSVVDQLLATGGGAVAHRLISALAGSRPGTVRTARAVLAGAGAAFLLSLLRGEGERLIGGERHGARSGARAPDGRGTRSPLRLGA